MITIRKYGNRRLYDNTRSRYMNLDELAELIRGGEDVRILDAKTEEDLTREVLLQVVLETLKGAEMFPAPLLKRIIRLSGQDPVQQVLRKQMGAGLELLFAQIDRMEMMMGGARGFGGAAAPESPAAGPASTQQAPPSEPPPEEEEEDEAPKAPDDELRELRERLAGLEKRLKGR